MATQAAELRFGNLATYTYPSGYDSTKLGLGSLIRQFNGGTASGKWAGPAPITVARPYEQATAFPAKCMDVVSWSPNIDWVFLGDNVTATTTVRVACWEFNKSTCTWSYQGFITFPAGPSGNRTLRGLVVRYAKYNTGTVTTSGTTWTGSGTAWQTSKLAVGSRIAIDTNDPTTGPTFYQIATITADGTLTTTVAPPAHGSASTYVIEELMVAFAETNATPANGGLWIAKGLRIEDFLATGYTMPLAAGTDNIKAAYLIKDAGSLTNQTSIGLADQGADSFTQHYVWTLDGTSTVKAFKYNLKAALGDLSASYTSATNGFVLATAASAATSGTAAQLANAIIAAPSHGPASGTKCLYFTTATRLYRSKAITSISSLDAAWLSGGDVAVEIPPGGASTFAATGTGTTINYSTYIDRFYWLSSGAAGVRSYITKYKTDGSQWDRIFLSDLKLINQSTADSSTPVFPSILAANTHMVSSNGMAYMLTVGTSAATCFLYNLPIGADWEFVGTTNERLVTPAISTPNCNKYKRAYVLALDDIGGGTEKYLGLPPEGYKLFFRTTGISDNSGGWTELESDFDLSGISGASQIQFSWTFKTISAISLPARILGICVTYDDLTTDTHYQPSVGKSDLVNKRFAFRFSTAFGSTVPALRIRLYDAVTNGELCNDTTTAPTGTWEKATDGSTWVAWTNADKTNETTYLRYTPASLGDSVNVRPLLTLA